MSQLTADAGGGLEDLVDLRIHGNVHIPFLRELTSPLLHPLINPVCEVSSGHGVDHIGDVASMEILNLRLLLW